MKTKLLALLAFLLLGFITLQAQPGVPTAEINGEYHLLEAERTSRGTTKQKKMEYGKVNGEQLLAALGCEQGCIPAVYTYQEEFSKKIGLPVFFNRYGIYMIAYDKNSFVHCVPDKVLGTGIWKTFRLANFYSKDTKKVASMTIKKATAYAISISKKVLDNKKD